MDEIEAIMAIYPLIFDIVDFKLQILRGHLRLYCCSVDSYYHSGGIFLGHVDRPDPGAVLRSRILWGSALIGAK
jgi:hypothetical protein